MSTPTALDELPIDILTLVAERLIGETQSLLNLSRTCRALHATCLPALLHAVDLSSHHAGRQPEHEEPSLIMSFDLIKAEYNNKYRPRNNLVPRQRAFLRLLTEKPELARYVRDFTWTLIWMDFDEEEITDIDRETWTVFGRLTNVVRLDLASLHEHFEEAYIRQNPPRLFPAVTELKLLGWMHRGLVKAIFDAVDARKLRSLNLDCLQDEGALCDGRPIPSDVTQDHSPCSQNDGEFGVSLSEEVIQRQGSGEAVVLPGPMWLPLRLLSERDDASLATFELTMAPFDIYIDLRIYYRMFEEVCKLIVRARRSLENLIIRQGESPCKQCGIAEPAGCGLDHFRRGDELDFELATALLNSLLQTLTDHSFPSLQQVRLEGFRIVKLSKSPLVPGAERRWELLDICPFLDIDSLGNPYVTHRRARWGYDYGLTRKEEAEVVAALKRS